MSGRPKQDVAENHEEKFFDCYSVALKIEIEVSEQKSDVETAINNVSGTTSTLAWIGFACKKKVLFVFDVVKRELKRIANAAARKLAPPKIPPPIEETPEQLAFWRRVVPQLKRKVDAAKLLAGAASFIDKSHDNIRRFIIYTHGEYYKPVPGYPKGLATAAAFFGEHSQLNMTVSYSDTFRCAKHDADIVAIIEALMIAKHIGMEYVCIRSQFCYVKNRVESNNFDGVSKHLMGKLRLVLEEFRDVSWDPPCTRNDPGAKAAKSMATY